ncbi:M3 family metallopeptidase [Brachybacterium sp. JHP9]|uniref:M3 family metallopeptidase n=1 Tax=Brachybacterium equifaecis TaxID=2910770 RepID=A0ABT0QZU8_9MICO|nr:M3 family metallopeptidase [Brachybacterium equifaecis]MCL6423065.1 M3 family metallopeptidase [Brachybacterium equifaecis]
MTPSPDVTADDTAALADLRAQAGPLAEPSDLPYGLPDFGAIRTEHFLPALRAGIAEHRAALAAISAETAPPTFENVLAPLELPSPLLERAAAVFFHLVAADGTEELHAIESEIMPELTALEDATWLDPQLFARVDALAQRADALDLDEEQRQILERTHLRFTLRGALLDPAQRERLSALNGEISRLQTEFSQTVTADMKAAAVHVGPGEGERLKGLDAAQLSAARTAAEDAGLEGWLIALILPTIQPLLSVLEDRGLRERLWRASHERGEGTWDLAARIAQLRAEKAQLLGFADFASLAVADRTARTPEAVEELFAQAAAPAMRNVEREAQRIAAVAAKDGITDLAPWDWPFYAERVQSEDFAVDQSALQPYFVLDRVLEDGVFRAAGALYGLRFTERTDLVPPHPLARIWEVSDEHGEGVGLFIGDYFTRDTKRGGAWMNTLVDQSRREGTRPVVMNTMNVSRPAPGEPAFVSLDEVTTMFHEFGHALHALLSDVEHVSVSGTSVPRDVVEFPSQVNEMWALRPGFVDVYARHVTTGEPVPAELLEKVRAAALWNEGFRTAEYLAAAVLDWRWHRLGAGSAVEDPHAFEEQQLEDAGLAHPLVAPRYRTGYFQHTFAGGYEAGYYSYLWAEVFDADSVAWFEEQLGAGRPLREVGQEFRDGVLGIGGSRDLLKAYRAFRGQERDVRWLLERRGLL